MLENGTLIMAILKYLSKFIALQILYIQNILDSEWKEESVYFTKMFISKYYICAYVTNKF